MTQEELQERIDGLVNTIWNDGLHEYDSRARRKEELLHVINGNTKEVIGEDDTEQKIFRIQELEDIVRSSRNHLRAEQKKRAGL